MAVMIGRDFAIDKRCVHGVNQRIEDHHVEVPDQYREVCEQGFVIVDGCGRVRYPFWGNGAR
jgi:hypothetical protein